MFVVLVQVFNLLLCGSLFGIALIFFRWNWSLASIALLFCGIVLLPDRGFSSQMLTDALDLSAEGGRWMFILLQMLCITLGIVVISIVVPRRP